MATLKSPTTVDGSKVITEATLLPGTKLNQVPIWNPTLHQWLPGDQTGASAGGTAPAAHDHSALYVGLGGGTMTGPLHVPSLIVAGHAVTANPTWASISGKPHTFPPSTHSHAYLTKHQADGYYAPKSHTHAFLTQHTADGRYATKSHTHAYAATTHTHAYLPIAGGTVTGATRLQASIVRNIWVYGSTPPHPHQGDIWMHG